MKCDLWKFIGLSLAILFCAMFSNCNQGPEEGYTDAEIREFLKLSPLPAPPPSPTNAVADNPDAALLGQMLFFNMDLSINGEVSCATCHKPELGFSDGKAVSKGLENGTRNAPTLWNAAYQHWFFWDGRTDSLWAQAIQPFLNKKEMGTRPGILRSLISNTPDLRTIYERVFGILPSAVAEDDPSIDRFLSNLGKALEAYQRKIISSNAPFDQWVASVPEGIDSHDLFSTAAKRGLRIFVGKGKCILCHSGPNFSDGEFHNLGLPRTENEVADYGRYEGIKKLKADRFNGMADFSDDRSPETNIRLRYLKRNLNNLGEFKTPTLRNIAITTPYMHDGRFATLREVIDFYSDLPGSPVYGHREETLTALKLSDQEKTDLEAFLLSLTDESLDPTLLRAPLLE